MTKVRTIKQHFNGNQYRHYYIEILDKKYTSFESKTLDIIGTISWQTDLERENNVNKWYGMTFKVETSEPDHLLKMGKLAKFIKENKSWDSQPEEILQLIEAKQYFRFGFDFIPVEWIGRIRFKVYDGG